VTGQGSSPATPPTASARSWRLPDSAGLLGVLALEIVAFSVLSPYFLDWPNLVNILTALSIAGVLACAGTLLMVAGQFDLSVGSGVGFTSLVLAMTAPTIGVGPAVVLAVLTGLAIGVANGFVVTVLRVNALITTIAMLTLLRGLHLVMGHNLEYPLDGFDWAVARPVLDVPIAAVVFLLAGVVFVVLMQRTFYGRRMYAIGANPTAARLVGIRVNPAVFTAFVLSGMSMALAGLMLGSQLGSVSGSTGIGLEFTVVTAIILGGTSLTGGVGTVSGTLIGLLIVGVLQNGLNLLNVDSSWQQVATGALLILAVAVDRLRRSGNGGPQ
jgi:ribose transport system permease protein